MLRKDKIKQIVGFLLALSFLYLALKFFLLPVINSSDFRDFTEGLGIFGYLVIIGYVVLSHVFAPIAGTPGVALGVTIYGIKTGMWLLYIGSLISASISFYISRKIGRAWVTKLVGKKSMKKVDEFTSIEGKEALAVSRLFGFSLFDFISYAAGLTNLKFRTYIIVTALFGLIPNLAIQYIFQDIDLRSEKGLVIWVGFILLGASAFGVLLKIYLDKKKKH